jgi:hypothetical protein
MYTFDESIVSDLHKDARGSRPGQGWWEMWREVSNDSKQKIWDNLCEELSEEIARQEAAEAVAIANYRAQVNKMIELGARDEHQAKKWIIQSMGADEHDLTYGGEWVCYELGLPYSMRSLFEKACREMRQEMNND